MIESVLRLIIAESLFPTIIGMSIGWFAGRGKLVFPIFLTTKLWFFMQVWIFTTVSMMLFASMGKVLNFSEAGQTGIAEFLLPIIAAAAFTKYRLWPAIIK